MLEPKSVNIRIPQHVVQRFEMLKAKYGGLPPSTIVRFLILDVLERPLEEQCEIMNRQIQRPAGPKPAKRVKEGLNAKSRLT